MSIQTLWSYLLSGNSKELEEFHSALGDVEISLSPWKQRSNGDKIRIIEFTTPLKNPMGPKKALNREELRVITIESSAFVLKTTATSKGVPFANAFENHVQWVAQKIGNNTRLLITGECKFTTPVWGPLKGTINKESVNGMGRAYRILESLLAAKFGIVSSATPGSIAVVGGSSTVETGVAAVESSSGGVSSGSLSFLQSPTNPAVLIMVLAMFIILWRMAMMNTMTMQVIKRLAEASRA